jgi:hypothetical protein
MCAPCEAKKMSNYPGNPQNAGCNCGNKLPSDQYPPMPEFAPGMREIGLAGSQFSFVHPSGMSNVTGEVVPPEPSLLDKLIGYVPTLAGAAGTVIQAQKTPAPTTPPPAPKKDNTIYWIGGIAGGIIVIIIGVVVYKKIKK